MDDFTTDKRKQSFCGFGFLLGLSDEAFILKHLFVCSLDPKGWPLPVLLPKEGSDPSKVGILHAFRLATAGAAEGMMIFSSWVPFGERR